MPFEVIDGSLQVRRVPLSDGGHDPIQPTRAVTLVLRGAIADFTESVEEHCSAKRILLFALGPRQWLRWRQRHRRRSSALQSAPSFFRSRHVFFVQDLAPRVEQRRVV